MLVYLKPATKIRIAAILSVILLALGVRAGLSVQGASLETAARLSPLSRVETSELEVGLVVDVTSASSEEVMACLQVLENLEVKATWFLTATFVEAAEGTVRELVSKGHEMGIKGTDEKRLDNLPQAEMLDRIKRSRQALMKTSVPTAPFFYAPGGRFSDALVSVAFQEGYQSIRPGVDLTGMKGKEADAARKMAGRISPGDILGIRVDKKGTLPAEKYLSALVGRLKEMNLSVVSLSRLFKGVK